MKKLLILSFITGFGIFGILQYQNIVYGNVFDIEMNKALIEIQKEVKKNKEKERIKQEFERKEIEKKKNEIKKIENEKIKKEVIKKKKIVKEEFPTTIQGLNTCFFESISLIALNDFGKKLDLKKIYKKMGMKYGDYFIPGSFSYHKETGGRFGKIKGEDTGLEILEKEYGFGFNQLVSINLIEQQLDDGEQGIFIAPMNFFEGKDEISKIWHAVAVYQIDNEFIYFSNTLTNKLEKIRLIDISNNGIMYFPILFTNNNNFRNLY